MQVASIRLIFAGLGLLPFAIMHLKKIAKKDLKFVLIVALMGNGIPAFLFSFAQTKIDSSLSGALNSLTPMFTLLVGLLLFKININLSKIIGVAIGLFGALILILSQNGFSNFSNFSYALLVVLASLCYAISVNTIKSKLGNYKAFVVSSTPLSFLLLPAILYLIIAEPISPSTFNASAWQSLAALAVLGLVGTAIALVIFNRLIQLSSAVFASSVTYLIPIIALFWGFMDGEKIEILQIVGLLIVLTGVYLTNKK